MADQSSLSFVQIFLFTLAVVTSRGQDPVTITGSTSDRLTGSPLPFVSLIFKKSLKGTVSNEQGRFDLRIPAGSENDTLLVNTFGYRQLAMPAAHLSSPLYIRLDQNINEIEEVKVLPQPPEHYIRLAMRNLKNNYPSSPFETVSYYREKVLENGEFVQFNEGVFRTFYPDYTDTVANQDQLLLYRHEESTRPVKFMSDDRKTRKAKRKGREVAADTSGKSKVNISASSFGGPKEILKSSKPGKAWHFLDTTELKNYRYQFGPSTTFRDREVMVIEFSSKGKVEHVREKGRIFLDIYNYALVRIENEGTLVIPVLIRPLLFMAGIGAENPVYRRDLEFQHAGGKWYPHKILYDISINATKRHFLSPNEHAFFELGQVFAVNRLQPGSASPVPRSKRFDPEKPMEEQVHNDIGISWNDVDVIKK